MKKLGSAILCGLMLVAFKPASASNESLNLRLTLGSSWQVRNDIQIPNNNLGTRFSLADAVGEGPVEAARLEINWAINKQHGIRVLLAPLSYTESVTFNETVQFAGGTFNPNESTEATYKFNSWRVGYHYSLIDNDRTSVKVGGTIKIRDAKIELSQNDTTSSKDNVGFVPLLYLAGSYQLSDRLSIGADLDGLAGGPGRAIDLGLALEFSLSKRWQLGAEVRVLDGGADTDTVYNFAQFNSAALVIQTGF